MFNKKLFYIILLMFAGSAMSAEAQLALSLDECIQIALNDNPTIKVKEMEITRVDYSHKEALGQLLPTINLAGQYTRNLSLQTMYMDTPNGTMAIKMGSDNTHAAGFQAQIPLVVPQLWKSIKLSENQILQNYENARANKLSLSGRKSLLCPDAGPGQQTCHRGESCHCPIERRHLQEEI